MWENSKLLFESIMQIIGLTVYLMVAAPVIIIALVLYLLCIINSVIVSAISFTMTKLFKANFKK